MVQRATNIRDIARRLKVTPGTVSRALNHAPGVGEKLRREILQLADELDYRVKPFRSKRTDTIGLLIGTAHTGVIENDFLDIVVNEVTREVSRRGLYLHLDYALRTEPATLPAIVAANRVDGVLLAGFPPAELCMMLRERNLPAVVLHDSAARTGLPTVQHNNFQAMRNLVRRFLDAGRRRIALLLTDRRFATIEHRYLGALSAFEDKGVPFPAELCLEGLQDNLIGGREGIMRLATGPLPEVIICANDCMAVGAMMECNWRGIRIPEEVELIGCGNYRQSAETFPPLTTIDTPWQATVKVALDLLDKAIQSNGENQPFPSELIVDAGIVWRESHKKF